MPYLKKISEDWMPVEHPNLLVGDTVFFTAPYEQLIREGRAILVDSDGTEMELPNQDFSCPICFLTVTGLRNFIDHISSHSPKKTEPVKEEKVVDKDATYNKRLAALEKARAARAAKKR